MTAKEVESSSTVEAQITKLVPEDLTYWRLQTHEKAVSVDSIDANDSPYRGATTAIFDWLCDVADSKQFWIVTEVHPRDQGVKDRLIAFLERAYGFEAVPTVSHALRRAPNVSKFGQ